MSDAAFQTFLVGGLLVLIGAVSFLAWSAWRWVDRERDMEKLALAGVGHELLFNIKRKIMELGTVAEGNTAPLLPVSYPQLDAMLSRPSEADRRAVTRIRGLYDDIDAAKMNVRAKLAQKQDVTDAYNHACHIAVESIATLYLWEKHKGRPPEEAYKTRSWAVRDWMKAHGLEAGLLPGLHLRDAVVERLRVSGMALTPKPLNHTASEYYAKLYNRKADPHAPMWRRKSAKAQPALEASNAETVSNTL